MSKKDPVNKFFNKEAANVAAKEFAIHLAGFKEKIADDLLDHYKNEIELKKYDKVKHLKSTRLESLPPRQMVQLDQLPKFQY